MLVSLYKGTTAMSPKLIFREWNSLMQTFSLFWLKNMLIDHTSDSTTKPINLALSKVPSQVKKSKSCLYAFGGGTFIFKRGASKTVKTILGGNIHYEVSYAKINR